jgi:hypothetical protein
MSAETLMLPALDVTDSFMIENLCSPEWAAKQDPERNVPGSWWKIEPDGSITLTYTYARRPYVIFQGEKKVVPFDILRLYFGDPRCSTERTTYRGLDAANNTITGTLETRAFELNRLRTFYGCYHTSHRLEDILPEVYITDVQNNPIVPLAFDPNGDFIYGHVEDDKPTHDVATKLATYEANIARMQQQMDALQNLVAQGDDPSPVTVDSPVLP